MSRTDPQMKIRLPDELKEAIERAAESAGRTLNAEVVQRLGATFAVDGDVAALARQVEALTSQRDDAYRAIRALQGTQEALAQLTLAVADHATSSKTAGAQSTIAAARSVASALLAPLRVPSDGELSAINAPAAKRRRAANV
ncbi:Arc family DNA-binding protein [Roseateles sp.]|uniref:Arc family DNA-binding protein n=1 Tax=Roseateles sp. TaxID=1971397 RepID=UPI0031CF8A5A